MRRAVSGTTGAALLCLFLFIQLSDAALAAETHTFDAVRSLTGGCTVSAQDQVEDPGCPGGSHPPAGSFTAPKSITTDSDGDIYVASYGKELANGAEGRIDVFDQSGFFLDELAVPGGPQSIAVDTGGNLYVAEHRGGGPNQVSLYAPSKYNPTNGEVEYSKAGVVAVPAESSIGLMPPNAGIAVNRSNDHLFVSYESHVAEFGSVAEENKLLEPSIGEGVINHCIWIALDVAHNRLYVSDTKPSGKSMVRIFELEAPYALLDTIEGATTPAKEFLTHAGFVSIGAEEATGHFFVDDMEASSRVYEFAEDGEYVSTVEHSFKYVIPSQIWVDNGASSLNRGYLFVPSNPGGVGHSYAFAPVTEFPPVVESISGSNVTESDALVHAKIDPGGLKTDYSFEYTTQQDYEVEEFDNAFSAGGGTLAPATEGVQVQASLTGLSPGTTYVVRVVVTNAKGEDEAKLLFRTFPEEVPTPPCSNASVRVGPSVALPDCRAYELVTPPDTNGRIPSGVSFSGIFFQTVEASPQGGAVSFLIEGGTLPGSEGGTGAFNGDQYHATRGPAGWESANAGPTAAEAMAPLPGSTSPDQGYSFWSTSKNEGGSALINGEETRYVRHPEGHSVPLGQGSLGVDPYVNGRLITEGGGHIVFQTTTFGGHTPVQLEEEAPPTGTVAVYDRTADEVTHVVSLLPGDETPGAGEGSRYIGASADGKGIAFEIGNTLYLRVGNETTYEIGENITFAGVSEEGRRIFYLEGSNLFAFDTNSEEDVQFTETGNAIPVNVSAGGTHAYFVSTTAIEGSGENPNGASAEAGKQNLYLSEEGVISFVATVTERDVSGEENRDGLGLWVKGLENETQRLGIDSSRTTPDGSVLLFESRANLTRYDSGGRAEVYRYYGSGETLECLSCNPTNLPAVSDASLESIAPNQGDPQPFSSYGYVPNLRADGGRAFFQTSDALLPTDTDNRQDVYEWEKHGVGSCQREDGCIYLISSGHTARDNYLYGVSGSGDDVFFITTDRLTGYDVSETPSIYDARVRGGFPPPSAPLPCQGEGCHPELTPAPVFPGIASPAQSESGNVQTHSRTCPAGKHQVKQHGKRRCVKNHRKRHHHKATKKGGRK